MNGDRKPILPEARSVKKTWAYQLSRVRSFVSGVTVTLMAAVAPLQSPAGLRVGDPAPTIENARWLGQKPEGGIEGKPYLVYFWGIDEASTIDTFNKLSPSVAAQATIIGIASDARLSAISESARDGFFKAIEKVLLGKFQDMKALSPHAIDTPNGERFRAWTKNDGPEPQITVVDKHGTVMWIGSEADEAQKQLRQLLSGNLEAESQRQRADYEKRHLADEQLKIQPLIDEGRLREALEIINRVNEIDPTTRESYARGKKALENYIRDGNYVPSAAWAKVVSGTYEDSGGSYTITACRYCNAHGRIYLRLTVRSSTDESKTKDIDQVIGEFEDPPLGKGEQHAAKTLSNESQYTLDYDRNTQTATLRYVAKHGGYPAEIKIDGKSYVSTISPEEKEFRLVVDHNLKGIKSLSGSSGFRENGALRGYLTITCIF